MENERQPDSALYPLLRNGVLDIPSLMLRYQRDVYTTCYYMLGNEEDAKDAAQGIWERVWRKSGTYKESEGAIRTWLHTISINYCRDVLRKQRRRRSIVSMLGLQSGEYDNIVALMPSDLDLRIDLFAALQQLDVEDRSILLLRYYYNYAAVEVAHMLNIPRTTIYKRIAQAAEIARSHLRQENNDEQ